MRHTLLRRIAVGSGAVTIALTTALSGVAAADETPANGSQATSSPTQQPHTDHGTPKVAVAAKFDKPEFNSGDEVTGSITIANTGDGAAHAVHLAERTDNLTLTFEGWPDIATGGAGVDIDAGGTLSIPLRGFMLASDKPIKITADLYADPSDPKAVTQTVDATATVKPTKGSAEGNLYFDTNGNGRFDKGEGLANVQITINGGVPSAALPPVKTGSDGAFTFVDIPAGVYRPSFDGLGDLVGSAAPWHVGTDKLHVDLEARHKVSDTLKASVKLTADTYKVGDIAHVTVALTNNGDHDLAGITAACARSGESHALGGDLSGWGDLAIGHRGVTVPAHGTVTAEVTSPVPAEARRYGYTDLSCDFGQFVDYAGEAHADMVLARVTGATASFAGTLLHDKAGVGGVKIYLTDHIVKKIVANTVTDAAGKFTFAELPAGLYDIGVVGPWKLTEADSWTLFEGANTGDIAVEPGPNQPDPYASTTAPTTPAPQALRVLANTGAADVQALTGAAILAVVFGAGLVLLSRRRRTS